MAATPVPLLERLRGRARDRRRRNLAKTGKLGAGRVQIGLMTSLLVLTLAVIGSLNYLAARPVGEELSLDELGSLIATHRVAEATFNDEDAQISGRYVESPVLIVRTFPGQTVETDALDEALARRARAIDGNGIFYVSYPRSDASTANLINDLSTSGARVDVNSQDSKTIVRLILTVLLPLMMLANLFAIFLTYSRGGGGGLGEVSSFGEVGDKRSSGDGPKIGFKDIAGIDDAVVELNEVVDYLLNPERYEELGAAAPKGVLLFGPPGVGKTLLAKAVAGEAGVPFFNVAGAEFVESLVGIGAARVRDLFKRVRAVAPAIVFIDELDAAGRRRGSGASGGGSDEREQTLNQLLVEMDGFDAESGIVVMAATNRPDILDPALLRPGRFDRHITIDKPDIEAREAILKLHAAKRTRVSDVNFADLARRTPGFSGADLANVVNEAALLTIRGAKQTITLDEFNEALQRVMSGPKRRGHLMSEEERLRIATHEAGHAVAAAVLGKSSDVHRISLVSRGKGLAATAVSADDDAVVLSRGQLKAQMIITLAGTAAEELAFDDPSTGGEDDLERVTGMARDMVGKYGMSDLGKMRILAPDHEGYLGGGDLLGDVSSGLHEAFDRAVRDVVEEAFVAAQDLLSLHVDAVNNLIAELLEHETLESDALQPLLPTASANGNGNGNGSSQVMPRKRTVKKTTAKRAPAKKTTAKKSPAKKTTKKSTSRQGS